jgi:hypothetical protein
MKTWDSGFIDPPFLTWVLDGGEWSASQPGRFTTGGKIPRYPLDRRLVGPQSRSERYGEEKILDPTGTLTSAIYRLILTFLLYNIDVHISNLLALVGTLWRAATGKMKDMGEKH